jgi:transposase-like protein
VEHRTSTYFNTPIERDHHHLTGLVRSMRRFKLVASAGSFCRGHAVIRNLQRGFSRLTEGGAPRLRLAVAWSALAAML